MSRLALKKTASVKSKAAPKYSSKSKAAPKARKRQRLRLANGQAPPPRFIRALEGNNTIVYLNDVCS